MSRLVVVSNRVADPRKAAAAGGLAVAFNPGFLQDPLRNLTEDEIHLEVSDEMSPGVIKVTTPFLYVLMPMRFS